jgi:hypothetical protein
MLDLRLKFVGNGHFVTATMADFEAAGGEYEIGQVLNARTSAKRSNSQNNYFHVIVASVWEHMDHERWPSAAHLKAHILNAVGHCDVKRFEPEAMSRAAAQVLRIEAYIEFFVDAKTREIIMKTPRRTRGLNKEEMGAVIDKTLDYISCKLMPGVDPEALRKIARAA